MSSEPGTNGHALTLGSRVGSLFSRAVFATWPFPFAHERLMVLLDPPAREGWHTRQLRGYPLNLCFDRASYIGRFLDYRGSYEEGVLRKLGQLLEPGMRVLDCGANIGLHAIVAAHYVGPAGSVLAIEPQGETCRRLEENIRLNHLDHVVVRNVALGAHRGGATLYHVDQQNDGRATLQLSRGEENVSSEAVAVTTLDRLVADAWGPGQGPDLVKIDVEGGEVGVLEGGRETFRCRPPRHLLVECIEAHLNRFGHTAGDLIGRLCAMGYEVRGLSAGRWGRVRARDGVNADLWARRI